jgi:nickel/cobalt exporter
VVISSYVLANEQQLRRGVLLSFISAMLQSVVAIAFVLIAAAALHLTSATMSNAANWIGIVSYGLVALLGLWLIVRKLFFSHSHAESDDRQLAHAHLYGEREHQAHHHDHDHTHDGEHEHDHAHVVTADQVSGNWREQLAVVLGVGLRPCSGALVVLVFALSQDVLPAGIAAVFLMGLGTAITVAVLATLATTAKSFAKRIAGTRAGVATAVIWWLELLGAVAVFAFGALLLLASF